MDDLMVQHFVTEYFSVNQTIEEGLAYVVEGAWYRDFMALMERIFDAPPLDSFRKIRNLPLIQPPFDLFFTTFDYELPVGYCITETKNNKLISNLQYQEDFNIVNGDLWRLLKKYFEADCEIIVFATHKSVTMIRFAMFETLTPGLIVPLDFVDLLLAVVSPTSLANFHLISTPMPLTMSLNKLKEFIVQSTKATLQWNISEQDDFSLYFDGKKVPLKGTRTLEKINVKHNMQLLIAIQDIKPKYAQVIEEEQDTEEEMIELDNTEDREQFKQLIEEALNSERLRIDIKDLVQIKHNLDSMQF